MTYKDEIVRLHKEGKSYNQIKDILGCSKGTISYHIGEGQKEKTIERTRSKRKKILEYIQKYKQNTPCTDCKEDYPYYMKDFDHLGNKSFTISAFSTHTESLDRIKAEIEKCEVVCANCHRIRTYSRKLKSGGDTLDVSDLY